MLSIVGSIVGSIGSAAWVYVSVLAFNQDLVLLGFGAVVMLVSTVILTAVNFKRDL